MVHSQSYFRQVQEIAQSIDTDKVERLVAELVSLRARGGRLFVLGVGGSAANASHAVNDFRKLCGIETYAPTDNVSELTARTNDEGWETVFTGWLKISRLSAEDAVFVFSVGGGNLEKNVSVNLLHALELAKQVGAKILGVVGRRYDMIDETIRLRFVRAHVIITVGILGDILHRFTGVLGDRLVEGRTPTQDFLGRDRDVRGLPSSATGGLVDHHPAIWQREALSFGARRQQDGSHRSSHPDAVGHHIALEEIDRVVDGHATRDHAARRIDVEMDILFGIFHLQEQQLSDHAIGHSIIDRRADENDAVF